MAEIMANMAQVINNSPQVNSLVGGHMAASEEAKRMAQVAESQRQQEALKSTVLALENSSRIGESDPDGRQRLESRREQRRRRRQVRSARTGPAAEETAERDSGCAPTPFESKPIIDVCV